MSKESVSRRWLTRGAVSIGVLFVVAVVALQLTGHSYFWTALRYTYLQGHTTAHIDDARNFAQAEIVAGSPASGEGLLCFWWRMASKPTPGYKPELDDSGLAGSTA
jgi:uncharacterized membrane protein YedE/YeeE